MDSRAALKVKELCHLFLLTEDHGAWPSFLKHWQLVFLSKGKPGIPNLEDLRPVAISSVLYRVWGGEFALSVSEVIWLFALP